MLAAPGIAARRLLLWAAVLWSCLTAAFAQNQAPNQPPLRVAVDPWIAWAPAHVAQFKGFWKRRSVPAVVDSYPNGDCVQAFVAGKADFAFMMAGTAVGLHVSGACDLVVLAEVDWSHGGDKMLVNKGKKLADLKGKRIGIYEDSPAVMMFLAAKLKAEKLAIADFKIVVIEDMESLASQFTNGRIAVAISYEPFVERATANGACEVVATTADFPGVMPEVLVARRASLTRIPPGRVAALIAGWLDAVEWSQDPANAKAFADLCATKVFVEEKVEPGNVAALLANVRIHGVPELRHRNFEDVGLPTFLRECAGFAGHRGTFDVTRLFDGKPLQRAIELHTAPSSAPAK